MQQFITADKSIIEYILHKVRGKAIRYKRRNRLYLQKEKMYIVSEGVFIRKVGGRQKTGVEFLDDSTVLFEYFYRTTDSEIIALTASEIIELDANEVIDVLEKGEVLSALLFYILEQSLINRYYFERQFDFSCGERVALFLKETARRFGKKAEQGVLLPKFLTIQLIASYCCCSRGSVSETLNLFRREELLSQYENYWYIHDIEAFHHATDRKTEVTPII